MAAELQKQSSETLQTERRLFRESQERELAGMLYMMGQQYRLTITPEMSALWTSVLIDNAGLSGRQIRDGFLAYFGEPDKCAYPPQPGDIRAMIPEVTQENETLREMKELKRREAQGEKFFGWADALVLFRDKMFNKSIGDESGGDKKA